jgi:hypothetical protein
MKTICRAIFILLSIFVSSQSLRAATLARSMSPSRQFIIYGANATLRGAVSELAEQTKTNLLALLRQPDGWKTAIVVNLQSAQANLPEIPPAALRFSQTGFGLKLQFDLTIGEKIDATLVERELLRAILLEMIYRSEPDVAPGTAFVEPPDWLLEGVLALTPGRDRGPLVEALLVSVKRMSLEKFLQQRPALVDSPGRLLYRAYSLSLVQLLVSGIDGHSRLARYIHNLSRASNDPLADLKAQFPLLGEDAEKTWQSAVARLGDAQSYQLLTFAESEQRLNELLRVKTSDAGKSPNQAQLGELAQRKPSAAEKMALNEVSQNLVLFTIRANPVMRPIVREYQQIAELLARGKRKRIIERLARLQITHTKLVARMNDVDDYMNWFEATQSNSRSGVFADYLKAAEDSQIPAPRRRDALSVYLDSLAEQFED